MIIYLLLGELLLEVRRITAQHIASISINCLLFLVLRNVFVPKLRSHNRLHPHVCLSNTNRSYDKNMNEGKVDDGGSVGDK